MDHPIITAEEFKITKSNKYEFVSTSGEKVGHLQEFIVPETGVYNIEVWGAMGGFRRRTETNIKIGGKGIKIHNDF